MSLRVLQVIPALNGGGVEEETLQIACALKAAGGHPFVASQGGALVSVLQENSIPHFLLPLASKNPLQIFQNSRTLANLVRTHRIDLLHVRSRAPAWSVALCSRCLGIPWITTYHAAYGGSHGLKQAYNSVMARASRVIAISAFIENHIKATYRGKSWFKPENLRLIPRGINLEEFSPEQVSPSLRDQLRKRLDLPPYAPLLLLPGRFRRIKGHDLLLRAFAGLRAEGSEALLLLVGETSGDSAYSQELQHLARTLGVMPFVRFLPYTRDLRPFYALADIVIIPSRVPEGFGRVIAEACAFEKRVVVSNHGAAPEIIQAEQTGFLFIPNDVESLSRVLQEALILSPSEVERLQQNARQRVSDLFSHHQFHEKTLEVYREVVGRRGAGASYTAAD